MASGSKKIIVGALLGNALIAIAKFVGASISGSSAMISEGIHSLVDTGNQVFLLLGMKKATKEASEKFPFGHGNEIYFWSFIVSILIFAVGAGLSIYEGISHILNPSKLGDPTISYIVLALSMVIEGTVCFLAFKEFNKVRGNKGYFEAVRDGKDPILFVVLFEDLAAMLGLIVAFIGIFVSQYTRNPVFDGISSVVIGLILASVAFWLAVETKGLLIGESASKTTRENIRKTVEVMPEIDYINEIVSNHFGPNYVLVIISLDFKDYLSAGEVENAIDQMSLKVKSINQNIQKVFIEVRRKS